MDKRRLKFVRRADRIASRVITIGGVAVVISVVGILLLIISEALPLFSRPDLNPLLDRPAALQKKAAWIIPGNYQEQVLVLYDDGSVKNFDIETGSSEEAAAIPPPVPTARIMGTETAGRETFSVRWTSGHLTIHKTLLKTTYNEQGVRRLQYRIKELGKLAPPKAFDPRADHARFAAIRGSEASGLVAAWALDSHTLLIEKSTREENFLGEVTENKAAFTVSVDQAKAPISAMSMDEDGTALYLGTEDGSLYGWHLREDKADTMGEVEASTSSQPITALQIILGQGTVVAGTGDGSLSAWSLVRRDGSGSGLRKLHDLPSHEHAIQTLFPSERHRAILSIDAAGVLQFAHVTSERLLYRLDDLGVILKATLSNKGDTLSLLAEPNELHLLALHNPHPETSVGTLFGKVWYESYPEPEHVWQSSSASDDFEPKLSLVPLIFGSLKGTFYAMLFSVPLALFGALYTSQFTSYRIRNTIKPTVEIMASIPSVVVGFLAALWFAPLVERNLSGFFLSLGFLPMVVLLIIVAWQYLRKKKTLEWIENGYEFMAVIPGIILAVVVSGLLGFQLERVAFGGNLQLWLYENNETIYDPRNCIIIAFALGFAVIPIIFTIAEDAFSNVPKGLRAASLALGASRWQTVWRVILPSASPGIFAAIVIGLGRAVGETMIVLMATGNTPIIDWSAFNGMRTLSANIAVEIPEAPLGGTLYRVLFLSAVILFIMTFILNTGAELVRDKLRKRYGQFQ